MGCDRELATVLLGGKGTSVSLWKVPGREAVRESVLSTAGVTHPEPNHCRGSTYKKRLYSTIDDGLQPGLEPSNSGVDDVAPTVELLSSGDVAFFAFTTEFTHSFHDPHMISNPRNCKLFLSAIVLAVSLTSIDPVLAAGPEPIRLWPQGAPGQQGNDDRDIPLIRIYAPAAAATGTAVVILPGGGYGGLAMDHEGHQIAKWWNRQGVLGAVVTYRHGPKYQHPAPLQDAQRAIRYLRAHAVELGIDPQRVGVMGFSAGGHLASTVSTHFDEGNTADDDVVSQQSSRPDFAVLCYPVISMLDPDAHRGSRRNLLGENPDAAAVETLSNHLQVTPQTPPTFLFHTAEDPVVPVSNALLYYQALVANQVPAELHVYQKGRHGVGLAPSDPILSSWPDRLLDWVRTNNFLTASKRVSISGEVKLHGQPLRWGLISFVSRTSRSHPPASTLIGSGKYTISREHGPVPGDYSVSIHDMGTFARTPTVDDARTLTGSHQQTGLVIQVTDQDQVFDFDLTVE